jgi:hypothetical protein
MVDTLVSFFSTPDAYVTSVKRSNKDAHLVGYSGQFDDSRSEMSRMSSRSSVR